MKNKILNLVISGVIIAMLGACSVFKNSAPIYEMDLVCHMKVDKSEAYTWKYKGVVYFFDSNNCRESFKMNPENILNKNGCDPKK